MASNILSLQPPPPSLVPTPSVPSTSPSSLFKDSTHCRFWLFSRETLDAARRAANAESSERVLALQKEEAEERRIAQEQKALQESASLPSSSPPPLPPPSEDPSNVSESSNGKQKKKRRREDKDPADSLLSADEETLIRRKREEQILELCRLFPLPDKVAAAAALFFKRFFLTRSVMEFDALHVLLGCMYIACKAEEFYLHIDELLSRICTLAGIPMRGSDVLPLEIVIMEALHFHIQVFLPFHSLTTFVDIMKNAMQLDDVTTATITREATGLCLQAYVTDAPLLYAPGAITLAALQRAANIHGLADPLPLFLTPSPSPAAPSSQLLQAVSTPEGERMPDAALLALAREVTEIVELLHQANTPMDDMDAWKRAERKLNGCRSSVTEILRKKKEKSADDKDKKRQEKLKIKAKEQAKHEAELMGLK